MRPQKIDDQVLLSGLLEVLSSKGYDGASLNELASSSGLQKASLYHRFPGGKKDIALAVLRYVQEWIENNIIKTLNNQKEPPTERLNLALLKIYELYQGGQSTCILRALSMDHGMEQLKKLLASMASQWVDAFQELGKAIGMDNSIARESALQSLVEIQGSLVVAKLLDDKQIFKGALQTIRDRYNK